MGRGASHSSGGGSGGRSKSDGGAKANNANSASRIGNMSREERTQYLENAPEGTRITGLYSKRTGAEVVVEKEGGYVRGYGPMSSMVGPQRRSWWRVEAHTDDYIARTLRTAADGTNKYYTTIKPKR